MSKAFVVSSVSSYDKVSRKTTTVKTLSNGDSIKTISKGDTSGSSSGSSSSSGGGNSVINVYGAPADLASAKNILGTSNYRYVDTSSGYNAGSISAGSIIVGGQKAGGGVAEDLSSKGVVRLAGYDASDTAAAILSFATSGIYNSDSKKASEVVSQAVKNVAATVKEAVIPSSMGNLSPSTNTAAAIAAAQTTGATGSSALSGLTFDNLVGVFVGIAFVSAVMGIFKRG